MKLLLRMLSWSSSPLLCCSLGVAQATWIVSFDGSGDFRTIPQAEAAASPGDRIVVAVASFGALGDLVTSKGISVLIGGNGAQPFDVHVSNLPAGQQFSLSQMRGPVSTSFDMSFTDCAGEVFVDGAAMIGLPHPTIRVERCAFVSLNGCQGPALTVIDLSLIHI